MEDEEVQAAFFRAGVAAQIGFIFAALVGVGMVCLADAQMRMAHAVLGQLALLARNIF